MLIEKLQKVRNIIGRPIIITSGVRCEFYNTSIKASMNSSHILDSYGIGNAVDIACTHSKYRYELVQVAQKFFNRIGISGGSCGGFVHLDVDQSKVQEVMWVYSKSRSPSSTYDGRIGIQKGFLGEQELSLTNNSWQLEKLLGRSFLWPASCRFTKKKGVLK